MTVLVLVLIAFWLLLVALILSLRQTPPPLRRQPAVPASPGAGRPPDLIRSSTRSTEGLRSPRVW